MTLRTRLAVAVAILVAAVIAVSGWLAVDAAERELIEEVDTFLEDRVDRLGGIPLLEDVAREGRRGRGGFDGARRFGQDALSEDDAVTQLITADGVVLTVGELELPVDEAAIAIARGDARRSNIETVEVDGTEYRVITARLGRGAALMVGRDLAEIDGALDGLARRTVVLGLIGAALAALGAWVLATRLSRPIGRLTLAAEHVAATQELSAPIEVTTSDEVGRLATSFNTMLEALDTSRRQQRRLIMDASHELRTPLTSLRTNVDLLKRAPDMEASDRTEVLDDVSGELEELTSLVTELVELATSSRAPDAETEPVSLVDVVQLVADRARRRSGRAINVSAAGSGVVEGHPGLLERAVSNLVDNALKFSPPDTAVDIAVDGGRVLVRDRGPGIAAEDREHVFDRFYRAPATRAQPGSGLGLAIVHDIVTSHGGDVVIVDPDDGPGAAIGFHVPVMAS